MIPSLCDIILSIWLILGRVRPSLPSPYHNRNSAFPSNERKEFKLYVLLPPDVQTLEEQVKRAYQQYSSRADELTKNTFMTNMKEQSQVLYYKI